MDIISYSTGPKNQYMFMQQIEEVVTIIIPLHQDTGMAFQRIATDNITRHKI